MARDTQQTPLQSQGGYLGHVLVLGMGLTGSEVARYCIQLPAARVASVTLYGGSSSTESTEVQELRRLGVQVVVGTEAVEGSYDLCITSPGIPEHSAFICAARSCSRELVSEPEFAWREMPLRWVAITGTNGKTTTTTLATKLLEGAGKEAVSVGNIGNLATGALKDRSLSDWFVAELSSFQLALADSLHPRVAVLLNITPDHLSWHGSLEAYAKAKEKIFSNLTSSDLAIISAQDSWCKAIAQRLKARNLRVCTIDIAGESGGPCAAYIDDGLLCVRLDGKEHKLVRASELNIFGNHNLINALAASALALELGCSDCDVASGLREFLPLEHRVEPCGEREGVRFVNDSKATNADAVVKALAAFTPKSVVLLAGGYDKGTELADLVCAAKDACALVVCFGAAGPRIAKALRESSGASLRVEEAPHLVDALRIATLKAQPGQTVLLSPACSSFDEFSSFEERGRVFKTLVSRFLTTGEVA